MTTRRWFVSSCCGAVVAGLGTGVVFAQAVSSPHLTTTWQGGAGSWSTAASWAGGVVPNNTIAYWNVHVDHGNILPSSVTVNVPIEIASLSIDPGDRVWIGNGQALEIRDDLEMQTIDNRGIIVVGGTDRDTSLLFDGNAPTVLSGGGTLFLSSTIRSRVGGTTGSQLLINTDNTIQGAGRIGLQKLAIDNRAVITGNDPLGILTIQASSGGIQNSGEIRAADGGKVVLKGSSVDNARGVLAAGEGSIFEIYASEIHGGMLIADEGGSFVTSTGPVAFDGVHLQGEYEITVSDLVLDGDLINDGSVSFVLSDSNGAEGQQFGQLLVPEGAGTLTIDGTGEIAMQPAFIRTASGAMGRRVVNGAGHTISGKGEIGSNTIAMTNQGTIVASEEALLIFNPPAGEVMINEGMLRAAGADPGGIVLTDGEFANYGVIEVLDGSRLVLPAGATMNNATGGVLDGGTWRVLSEGHATLLWLTGNSFTINNADVTLRGTGASFPQIDDISFNQGSLALQGGRDFTSGGFLNNSGTLEAGLGSYFVVNGDYAQSGGATLRLHVNGNGAAGGLIVNTGTANLDGTLHIVSNAQPYNISGLTLPLVSATEVAGAFDAIIAPAWLEISVTSTGVEGTVVDTCFGDINYDGIVNSMDMLLVISAWGNCPAAPTPCPADLTGDGVVGALDVLYVNNAWGACP